MFNLNNYVLAETKQPEELTTREANQFAAEAMAKQATRFLDICSRDLDPFIYDQADFVKAVKKIAISNRYAKIRILLAEPERIIKRGHRLLDLAFHLSSFIELKKLSYDNKDFNEGILIADKAGYIHRKNDGRYEGKFNFNDLKFSQQLLSKFDELWETAKPDPNLRRVAL